MAVKIKPLRKFTTGTPSTSDMVEGEIAVNTADKKVFMRDDANNIVEVGAASSLSLPIGGGTITGALNVDGNATLGNATTDDHIINGTLKIVSTTNEQNFELKTTFGSETSNTPDLGIYNNSTQSGDDNKLGLIQFFSDTANYTKHQFADVIGMAFQTGNAATEGGITFRFASGSNQSWGSNKEMSFRPEKIQYYNGTSTTTLAYTTPTSGDVTITLPNTTGTVALTASPTFTGTVTTPILRITGTTDASLSSTAHGFQVGATSGTNVIIDGNEIMARNNSAASGLYLQNEGGAFEVGKAGNNSTIKLYGRTTIFDGNLSLPSISGDGYEAALTVVTSSIDADNLWDDINSDGNNYSSMPSEIAIKNLGNNTTNSFAGIFMMPGETSDASYMNAARIGAIREGAGRQTAIGFATRQTGGDMVEVGRFKSTKQFNLTGDIELEGASYITTLTKTAPTAARTITFPDATGQVVLSDGAIDTDSSAEIGKAHVGHMGWNDYAGFSHVDQNAQTTYSLLQKNDGKTYLNAATGQTISQRINNVEVLSVASSGIAITGTLNTHTIPSGTATLVVQTSDTDDTVDLGRAKISSSLATDIAFFSHYDQNVAGGFALAQNASGSTFVNAPTGQGVNFHINDTIVGQIFGSGFYLSTGMVLQFEGGTQNANYTNLTVTDPTAARTITLPDISGTVLTTANPEINGAYGSTSAPRIFKVTVSAQTAAHPYNGDGSTDKFSIDGIQGAALTLHGADNVLANTEYVYRFDQSDSTNANHPLRFYLDAAKNTAYTTNVTTNGTPGQAGAYTQIAVDQDTPQILYYQCSSHAHMGNYVIVPHSTNFKNNAGNISLSAIGGNIQLSGAPLAGSPSVKITGALETTGNIELGNASDTTISRSAAGTVQIEGNTVLTLGNSDAPTTTTSDGDADFVLIDDGGTMKKISPSDLGIGGGGGVTVQDEGSALSTTGTTLDFVGAGVVASGTGATKTITIAGGGSGITVQDEGSALSTAGTTLNFVGAGVTATGTGATKTITISGGGGGSGISTGKSIAMAMVFG